MTTTNETMDKIFKAIAGLILLTPPTIALIALVSIWHGYVLQILWGWFVVPGFGMQPISIPLAIGMSLLMGCFTMKATPDAKDDEPIWKTFTRAFMKPAMALLIGWIVTKFL